MFLFLHTGSVLEWVAISFFSEPRFVRTPSWAGLHSMTYSWVTQAPSPWQGCDPWRGFIGRTDAEAETPVLWPPDAKSWLIGKDPDEGEVVADDEIVRWHQWLNGHEFEQTPGDTEGQVCCSPCGCKESDMTEWPTNNKKARLSFFFASPTWSFFYAFTASDLGHSRSREISVHHPELLPKRQCLDPYLWHNLWGILPLPSWVAAGDRTIC